MHVALAMAAMAIVGGLSQTNLGRDLELRSVDARFRAGSHDGVRGPVELVEFNEDTRRRTGQVVPDRAMFAQLIERLDAAGATAIVLDVRIVQPVDATGDRLLLDAARRSHKVIFGTQPEGQRGYVRVPVPLSGLAAPRGQQPLEYARGEMGLAGFERATDGVVREVQPAPTVPLDGRLQRVPSLALAAMRIGDPEWSATEVPRRILINFTQHRFAGRYHNVADIVGPTPGDLPWANGKIVLVGATAAVLQDSVATPLDPAMPGVEVHATAVETLAARDWLRTPPPWTGALAALVGVLLVVAAGASASLRLTLLVGAGVIAAWIVGVVVAFRSLLVLPAVAPVACVLLTLAAIAAREGLMSHRERRRVQRLFSRYVSPDVVRELVESGGEVALSGERREVAVLFSDIRGFTSISEQADPTRLVGELNEYFATMLEAVEHERGTLDKFMGDGLMAIFGAPLHQPDHAARACRTALAMTARLAELNTTRVARGDAELRIGIGLHSGDAVVGNIGSPERRVDYTAIGDTVNLAARLESATKDTRADILVSASTRAQAGDLNFAERGMINVKGRSQGVQVSALLPAADAAADVEA